MRITKEARMHLETAELLIRGIQQSIRINDSEPGTQPPEHSIESIKRRCIQARQEILQLEHGISPY